MSDLNDDDRLQQAENDVALVEREVDEQLKTIHRLEAQGRDDEPAQQKLEELLEKLENAQQALKAARGSG